MKVLAGLVTQGSGSLGGMTMSKNKQGYYLRARTVPSNPNTLGQQAIRAAFSAISPAWAALSQARQAAWNLYAKNTTVVLNNGQAKVLSGFNWFLGANQLRLQAGEGIQNDAPSIFTLAQTPFAWEAFYVSPSSMAVKFSLLDAPTTPGTGDLLLVQIGRPQTLGTLYFKSPFQFVGTIDSFDAGNYVLLDVSNQSSYEANGSQSQWMRITRILPDGRYSTPLTFGPYGGYGQVDVYGFGPMPVTPIFLADTNSAVVPHTVGNLTGFEVIQQGSDGLVFSVDGNELSILRVGGENETVSVILRVSGDMGSEFVTIPVTLCASVTFVHDPWVFSTTPNGGTLDYVSRGQAISATSTDLPTGSGIITSGQYNYIEILNSGVATGVYPFTLSVVSGTGETVGLSGTMTVA